MDNGQCIIRLFGRDVNTASFALYTFSLSVLVQSLVIISMSGAADHGNYRKRLLLSFAFTGSLATMLFIAIVPSIYLLGAVLAIVANTCFGASFVLLNSFLPLLVRHHPLIRCSPRNGRRASPERDESTPLIADDDDDDDMYRNRPSAPLLASSQGPSRSSPSKTTSTELLLSTQISSYGIGIGYIAGVVVLILGILIILGIRYVSRSNNLALRTVLLLVGLWWMLFTIPAAMWLRPRPGPPLAFTSEGKQVRSWTGYVIYAWQSLGRDRKSVV